MGRGLGKGSCQIRPDRRLADDGKRFCDERCISKGLNGKGFGEGVVPDSISGALGGFFDGVFLLCFFVVFPRFVFLCFVCFPFALGGRWGMHFLWYFEKFAFFP